MTRLLLACMVVAFASAASAQTTKPKSPGEMAAADRVKAEKKSDCTRQAKQQKLGFSARRKFVKACVNS